MRSFADEFSSMEWMFGVLGVSYGLVNDDECFFVSFQQDVGAPVRWTD
jgi:hypothetical protein